MCAFYEPYTSYLVILLFISDTLCLQKDYKPQPWRLRKGILITPSYFYRVRCFSIAINNDSNISFGLISVSPEIEGHGHLKTYCKQKTQGKFFKILQTFLDFSESVYVHILWISSMPSSIQRFGYLSLVYLPFTEQ